MGEALHTEEVQRARVLFRIILAIARCRLRMVRGRGR